MNYNKNNLKMCWQIRRAVLSYTHQKKTEEKQKVQKKIIQFIAYINVTWNEWNQKKGIGDTVGKVSIITINTNQWQESDFLQERPGT